MKRLIPFLLSFMVMIGALAVPRPSQAYRPPLTAVTAWQEGDFVKFTVYDPQRGEERPALISSPASGTSNLTVTDGIVTWIYTDGSFYYIHYYTYDPFQGKWIGNGGFSNLLPDPPLVSNGVVAVHFKSATSSDIIQLITYDPMWPSGWIGYTLYPVPDILSLKNQEGIVAIWVTPLLAKHYVYDPTRQQWAVGTIEIPYGEPPISSHSIEDFAVKMFIGSAYYYNAYHWDTGEWVEHWFSNGATPLAYFVAQPTSGSSPLWVTFTDMSFGGTSWTYSFGDSTSDVAARSCIHTYTKSGTYNAKQTISSSIGSDNCTQVIRVSAALLPYLLLLD